MLSELIGDHQPDGSERSIARRFIGSGQALDRGLDPTLRRTLRVRWGHARSLVIPPHDDVRDHQALAEE